jgi:hypothetical protein
MRHLTRRKALRFAAAAAVIPTFLRAADLTDKEVIKRLSADEPRDKAIRRALEFIRSQQRPDGAVGEHLQSVLTSMALMAHFAAGHPPSDKQHGPWIRRSIQFVISRQNQAGYFGESDGSRMYGHGICTLMLAEALGMSRDDELEETIRRALKRAVLVTVNAALVPKPALHAGGWRYTPDATDSDLSLSGWQLMSLHAAQQVGMDVPSEVVEGAVKYARRLITDDGKVAYQNPGEDRPPLRGLALIALVIGKKEKDPVVKRIAARIVGDPIAWKGDHFYYRAYYEAVGLSRAASDEWEKYLPTYEAVLLPHQRADGAFDPSVDGEAQGAGPVYASSMAIMALAVQRYVLPAYQR